MLEKRIFLKGNKFRNIMELQANGILKSQTWSIAQILIFSCSHIRKILVKKL